MNRRREYTLCHRCRRASPDLTHCRSVDEYLCEDCIHEMANEHYDAALGEEASLAPKDSDNDLT
jgi:hypothetical protein